jgi:hypothetical protein
MFAALNRESAVVNREYGDADFRISVWVSGFVLSACGVIGSRARLRIWWSDPWGFESLHAHGKKQKRWIISQRC